VGDALCQLLAFCPHLQVDVSDCALPNESSVRFSNACNLQPPRFRNFLLQFDHGANFGQSVVFEPTDEELMALRCPARPKLLQGSSRLPVGCRSTPTSVEPSQGDWRQHASDAVRRDPRLTDISCELLCDRFTATTAGRATHLTVLSLRRHAIGNAGLQALAKLLLTGEHPLSMLDLYDNFLDDQGMASLESVVDHLHASLATLSVAQNRFTEAAEQRFKRMLQNNVSKGGVLQSFDVAGPCMRPDVSTSLTLLAALSGKSTFVQDAAWCFASEPPSAGGLCPVLDITGKTFGPSSIPSLLGLGIISGVFRFHGLAKLILAGASISDAGFAQSTSSGGLWNSMGALIVNVVTSCPRLTLVDVSRNRLSCSGTLVELLDVARTMDTLKEVRTEDNVPDLTDSDAVQAETNAAGVCVALAIEAVQRNESLCVCIGPWRVRFRDHVVPLATDEMAAVDKVGQLRPRLCVLPA